MKKIVILSLLVLFLAGCALIPEGACYMQAKDYVQSVEDIAAEWDDANELAGSTPRMSLAPQIAALQEIRRRAEKLTPPECADKVQSYLIAYMNAQIKMYLVFLAEGDDLDTATLAAQEAFSRWDEEYTKLISGWSPYDQ